MEDGYFLILDGVRFIDFRYGNHGFLMVMVMGMGMIIIGLEDFEAEFNDKQTNDNTDEWVDE